MNIAVFSSAASAFEKIDLVYIHCALKENFSVTLKGFTCASRICRELIVRSVATRNTKFETRQLGSGVFAVYTKLKSHDGACHAFLLEHLESLCRENIFC